MHELASALCRVPRASLGVVEHQSDRRATFPLLLCPLLAPLRAGTRDRHGRAPSSPVPRLFSPLSHQLRLPRLHAVLMLAVQNHAGSTAVAGRRRLRPPVRMAGPPRAASRPSETTSGRARDP